MPKHFRKVTLLPDAGFRHGEKVDTDYKLRNQNEGKPNYDPQKLLPEGVNLAARTADDYRQIFVDADAANHLAKRLSLGNEFSIEQIQAAMYFALPEEYQPTTEYIAQAVGICRKTLWTWRQDLKFQELKMKILRTYALRFAPDVLKAVTTNARLGCVKSATLLLELYGMIDKDKKAPAVQNNFIVLQNEEVNKTIAHLTRLEQVAKVRAKAIPTESAG